MPDELHFLVVDDISTVRCVVATLLKGLGYHRVSEAADGEEAFALLVAGEAIDTPINFVITDWNMPGMDGLALLRAVRATPHLRHLPVLMITAEMEARHVLAAAQAGVDGYIAKSSLSADVLKTTLKKILADKGWAA